MRDVIAPSNLSQGLACLPSRDGFLDLMLGELQGTTEDTPDYSAIGDHVIVVIVPVAGWAAC